MPNIAGPTEEQVLSRLVEALQDVPGLTVERYALENQQKSHDARVELQIGGQPLTLLVECKRDVFPAQAREALWQFRDYLRPGYGETVAPLVAAHTITAGARELMKKEGLGFFDNTGTLYLPAQRAFVYVDRGLPAPRGTKQRSLFAQRRSQAVHALLREPKRWFGVNDLAQVAGISPATASEVVTTLDNLEWVQTRGQGPAKERQLAEPAQLLDAWAAAFASAKRPSLRRYFVPRLETHNQDLQIAAAFEQFNVDYAVSHEAAAQRLAPLLTHVGKVRMRVHNDAALAAAIEHMGAQVVDSGWNLGLWEADAGGLQFRERLHSAWHASVFHVYLDLIQTPEGRSKELAEHLRKERIGF